ncbi:hypothetical protein KBC97_00555 [Candidatus Gracilibacteria bacterium]|nr:hypothetical protein [Candidatus Gracilibacteria bacterium]
MEKKSKDLEPTAELTPVIHPDSKVDSSENDLAQRIELARNEYFDMYESDPVTWGTLNDKERFNHLVDRLKAKGIDFSLHELIALKVSLLVTRARRKDHP